MKLVASIIALILASVSGLGSAKLRGTNAVARELTTYDNIGNYTITCSHTKCVQTGSTAFKVDTYESPTFPNENTQNGYQFQLMGYQEVWIQLSCSCNTPIDYYERDTNWNKAKQVKCQVENIYSGGMAVEYLCRSTDKDQHHLDLESFKCAGC